MPLNEKLREFRNKIIGTWCNQETNNKYSVLSRNKITITQAGFQPVEFDYELNVGENGYTLLFNGQTFAIEVMEETDDTLIIKVSNERVIKFKRC
jgi:hypothetical protein